MVNLAKPSSKELCKIFGTHISGDALVLTDGLRNYNSLESTIACSVIDVNHEKQEAV